MTVYGDRLVENSRIAAKPPLPIAVAQNGNGMAPGVRSSEGLNSSPQCRRHAEHLEVVSADEFAVRAFGRARHTAVKASGKRASTPENTSLRSRKSVYMGYEKVISFIVRPMNAPGPSSSTSCAGIVHGKRPQQHLIHQRKNRRVCADSQAECENDD